jgi:CheY-like chemotaxis protein
MTQPDVPSILLIGSDPGFAYLLERYAQRGGCRLTQYIGADLAAAVDQYQPNVVIIDAPEPRSWEVIRQIKAQIRRQHIPVVLCSTMADPTQAQRAGASSLLHKPVLYTDFLAALAAVGTPVRQTGPLTRYPSA